MGASPAVVAVGLEQRYGKHSVIRGLDVELARGGVVGLLGPNGSGKTTLVTTLATLRRPAAGSLSVMGFDPYRPAGRRAIRQQLGYLPQALGFHPQFTAQEFVEYLGWLKRVPAPRLSSEASNALAEVGLEERRSDKLGTLSGGMLRRAGIAAAIVNKPQLLLLDEPTAGLDPVQRVDLRQLVRRLGNECTVLLSTHLVEDVASMCSRALVMNKGTIAFSGSPQELVALGIDGQPGDSPMERGYSAALLGLSR